MARMTRKLENGRYAQNYTTGDGFMVGITEMMQKLGKLEDLQEDGRLVELKRLPFYAKPHADSTLMGMTKAELIEYIRMYEKNLEGAYATLDQQAANFKKLLNEQIEAVVKQLKQEAFYLDMIDYDIQVVMLREAIKIVKAGGRNE